MSKIRVTFYTESDDFPSEFSIEQARDWVRSRVSGPSTIETPAGVTTGPTVDELDDSDLARWLAAISLKEVRSGRVLNVRERPGKWVAIAPERVQAVGAEVDEDEGAGPGGDADDDTELLPFELEQPWHH